MSKDFNAFDKAIRDRLEHHPSAVPEDMFDRIQSKRAGMAAPVEQAAPSAWRSSGVLLLLLFSMTAAGLGYYFWPSEHADSGIIAAQQDVSSADDKKAFEELLNRGAVEETPSVRQIHNAAASDAMAKADLNESLAELEAMAAATAKTPIGADAAEQKSVLANKQTLETQAYNSKRTTTTSSSTPPTSNPISDSDVFLADASTKASMLNGLNASSTHSSTVYERALDLNVNSSSSTSIIIDGVERLGASASSSATNTNSWATQHIGPTHNNAGSSAKASSSNYTAAASDVFTNRQEFSTLRSKRDVSEYAYNAADEGYNYSTLYTGRSYSANLPLLSKRMSKGIAFEANFGPTLETRAGPNVACIGFSPLLRSSYFTVDVSAAPAMSWRALTPTGDTYATYADQRAEKEMLRGALSTTARFGYHHFSGIFALVGVDYTQLQERFKHDIESEEPTTVFTVVDTIVDASGNVNIVYDTISVVAPSVEHINTANRYRSINVPLTIGYELNIRRFAFAIHGGAELNLISWQSGKALAADGSVMSLRNNDQYHSRTNVNIVGGLSAAFRITPKWEVFAEPRFKYMLGSLTKNSSPVEQRYVAAGLGTGVRLRF